LTQKLEGWKIQVLVVLCGLTCHCPFWKSHHTGHCGFWNVTRDPYPCISLVVFSRGQRWDNSRSSRVRATFCTLESTFCQSQPFQRLECTWKWDNRISSLCLPQDSLERCISPCGTPRSIPDSMLAQNATLGGKIDEGISHIPPSLIMMQDLDFSFALVLSKGLECFKGIKCLRLGLQRDNKVKP